MEVYGWREIQQQLERERRRELWGSVGLLVALMVMA